MSKHTDRVYRVARDVLDPLDGLGRRGKVPDGLQETGHKTRGLVIGLGLVDGAVAAEQGQQVVSHAHSVDAALDLGARLMYEQTCESNTLHKAW
jgi:hypothetical protein